MGRKKKEKTKQKSDIAMFNEEARRRGMSYGKLQVLETCGKVKQVNGYVEEVKK